MSIREEEVGGMDNSPVCIRREAGVMNMVIIIVIIITIDIIRGVGVGDGGVIAIR
jgi:hypothetical protein